MKQLSAVFAFLALATLMMTPAIYAQANRTWVSSVGDDANSCSRTAPCKTLAGAISKTAAGGKISVFDSGDFDAVIINKAITINGDGTFASSINGVIVNAGPSDRVILRNLSINSTGSDINGIRFLTGKSLTVENSSISGFTGRGIDVTLTATGDLFVKNTSITNCGTGVFISTTGAFVLAALNNVDLKGNANGVEASTNGRVMISNSNISENTSNGLLASTASSQINVEGCQIAFNALVGVNASVSGSAIRLSNNQIYNNTTGISISGGATVSSAGNNRVFANGGSTAPNGPAITVQ